MGLNCGAMDRAIVLQVRTLTQSESGEQIETWANVTDGVASDGTLAAQWMPGGTSEAYRSQQRLGSYIDGVYRIYYRTEPTPDAYRIIGHDGRVYDLKPAVEIGREEGWSIPVIARGE